MFKLGSFEEELYKSMEKQLVSNQAETKYGFNKLAKVFELLKTASDIFDDANMLDESKQVDSVLNNLVKKLEG